jgi:hypothetical protein
MNQRPLVKISFVALALLYVGKKPETGSFGFFGGKNSKIMKSNTHVQEKSYEKLKSSFYDFKKIKQYRKGTVIFPIGMDIGTFG